MAKINPRPIFWNRSSAGDGGIQPSPEGPAAIPPTIQSATVGKRPLQSRPTKGARATTAAAINRLCKSELTRIKGVLLHIVGYLREILVAFTLSTCLSVLASV